MAASGMSSLIPADDVICDGSHKTSSEDTEKESVSQVTDRLNEYKHKH